MKRTRALFNYFLDEIDNIEKIMRQMAQNIIMYIIEAKFEDIKEFWTINRFIRNSGQAYLRESDIDDKMKRYIYSIGYSDAVLDGVQMYLEKMSVEKEIDKIKTKYRDSIFGILTERRTMFHGDLAKELEVSPSALNDIIKHMNASEVQLVNVERISKYTLYSLTPLAYQYYIKKRGQTIPPRPTKKVEVENTFSIKINVYYDLPEVKVMGLKVPKLDDSELGGSNIELYRIPNRKRTGRNKEILQCPYISEGERIKNYI